MLRRQATIASERLPGGEVARGDRVAQSEEAGAAPVSYLAAAGAAAAAIAAAVALVVGDGLARGVSWRYHEVASA